MFQQQFMLSDRQGVLLFPLTLSPPLLDLVTSTWTLFCFYSVLLAVSTTLSTFLSRLKEKSTTVGP